MSTTTKARSRRKPERRIRLLKPIKDGIGAVQIFLDGEPHNYLILPLASDFGAAFRLIKQELLPCRAVPTRRDRPAALLFSTMPYESC